MPFLFEFCQWLQDTDISTQIRESNLLFPFIEGTHLLGLGVSAGTIAMSDLRLLGVLMKKQKASKVFDSLLPFTIAGTLPGVVEGHARDGLSGDVQGDEVIGRPAELALGAAAAAVFIRRADQAHAVQHQFLRTLLLLDMADAHLAGFLGLH